jgi:hypothetical protein
MAVVAMDTTPNTKAKNLVNFIIKPFFFNVEPILGTPNWNV